MGPGEIKVALDTCWVLLAAFLVFFMNAGFALVEAGLCRRKNATNILAKNFVVFAIATLTYWAVGFALMFSDGNSFVGLHGWFLSGADASPAIGDAYHGIFGSLNWTGIPLEAKFFFELVFAGTAATIVSGAVAERVHYKAFILFAGLLTAVVYPVVGHWIWGGGWLAKMGMMDFAGSTVVHAVGGSAALAGALLLGPRLGKYGKDGKTRPIPGHSMALVTLGGLILWLGWFGFNPGSTMAADGGAIAHIALTTNLAAAAGTVVATLYAWMRMGKPDLSLSVNGCLAGLVAITAPCAFVTTGAAALIGAIAGFIVIEAVIAFDRVRIDDPVGATSVHLVCGIFGTLCVGLFGKKELGLPHDGLFNGGGFAQLYPQAVGVGTAVVFSFAVSYAFWYILKKTMGIRVSEEAELLGLDISEMGMEAYPADAEVHSAPTEATASTMQAVAAARATAPTP